MQIVRLSTRYGLAGISALALLSVVHWLRDGSGKFGPIGNYLIGVLPNFAAAIAITFVLLSIWADQKRDGNFVAAQRWFAGCASVSGVGLIGWEFFQRTSRKFVFDPHDVLATFVGIGTASLLFYVITPRVIETG